MYTSNRPTTEGPWVDAAVTGREILAARDK
jgi:hypothetical protein